MRRTILIVFTLLLSLACESKEKNKVIGPDTTGLAKTEHNTSTVSQNKATKEAAGIYNTPHNTDFDEESHGYTANDEEMYTFDRFKDEFNIAFNNYMIPMGTYFFDEFEDIEIQYGLTENESKLLGKWMNVTFYLDLVNNYYTFFPNKLFILTFNYKNIRIISSDDLYFEKALGTWEISNGIVQFTIYAIIIQEASENYFPYSKDSKSILFVEHPYTVDFININDIGKEGYTRRPINDTILSNDLQQKVRINEPNASNNLYVRNVYSIDVITDSGQPEKNYGYFRCLPEMARENHSGLDIVMDPELIKRYIPDWMY